MTMKIEKNQQIGKVRVRYIKTNRVNAPVYSDGAVESELYHKFKCNPNYNANSDNRKFSSWAHEYHLTPVRHNLLKWFPFKCDGHVLEVGAGCGALTGLLCSKLKRVIALEYSCQRALVTAQRHSECSNLEVIVGGLQDYESYCKFDYITVIGVLEYAATFFGGKKPFESFLTKLREMLKPTGELILAIENKIGLKYITGAPEDHTGQVFYSIYNYPYSSKVKTFSKRELASLLRSAGLGSLDWYYPLPDYKMPQVVLSDKVKPRNIDSFWSLFPAETGGAQRKEILSERRFGKTIAEAGLFGEFANSFLVVGRMRERPERIRCLRFTGANQNRKPRYRTSLGIFVSSSAKTVIRSADNDEAVEFTKEISERETLAKKFFEGKAVVVTGRLEGSSLYYPYIGFPSLEELVADAIEEGDLSFGRSLVEEYVQFVHNLPSHTCIPEQFMREFDISSGEIPNAIKCLDCTVIDCIPRNIKVGPESWYIIDNEWTKDYPLPIDYLIFRGLAALTVSLQPHIQDQVSENRPVVLFWGYGKNRQYIPLSWLEILETSSIPLNRINHWETHLQNKICTDRRNLRLRLKKTPTILTQVRIAEITPGYERPSRIHSALKKVARRLL